LSYDPNGSGTLVNVQLEGFGLALARSSALLDSMAPLFDEVRTGQFFDLDQT
jgi:hypothetical protein